MEKDYTKMTFDKNDLVERLRHTFEDEAADRIEELEAQLAVAGKALNRLLRPPNGHPHIEAATKEEWAVRAMNAEDKLAKVTEALRTSNIAAVLLATKFHEIYERLAPEFGYDTREDTRTFDTTSQNGKLMVAVCTEILAANRIEEAEKLCDYCDEADPLRQAMCLAKECGVKDV